MATFSQDDGMTPKLEGVSGDRARARRIVGTLRPPAPWATRARWRAGFG